MVILFFLLILPAECATLDVRLTGGDVDKYYEGRLEVTLNGVDWGTVCADFFDDKDAKVVCHVLGHPVNATGQEATAWPSKFVPDGHLDIFLDNVNCKGDETNLADCWKGNDLANSWSVTDCTNTEDVGVQCGCQKGYRKADNITKECEKCVDNCNYCDKTNHNIPKFGWKCNEGACAEGYTDVGLACTNPDEALAVLKDNWLNILVALVGAIGGLVLLAGIVHVIRVHCCKKGTKEKNAVQHRASSHAAGNDDVEMKNREQGDGLC